MSKPATTDFMCHCFAVRQAARTVTQLYDQHLAAAGLRATQFSILMKLQAYGPLQINNLAARMHLDRSTLGRNILPLQREGLVEVVEAEGDRRAKPLQITGNGLARLKLAKPMWKKAQAAYEEACGAAQAAELSGRLHEMARVVRGVTPADAPLPD
jgi:DNA-binding MarR family transcriptional regulator